MPPRRLDDWITYAEALALQPAIAVTDTTPVSVDIVRNRHSLEVLRHQPLRLTRSMERGTPPTSRAVPAAYQCVGYLGQPPAHTTSTPASGPAPVPFIRPEAWPQMRPVFQKAVGRTQPPARELERRRRANARAQAEAQQEEELEESADDEVGELPGADAPLNDECFVFVPPRAEYSPSLADQQGLMDLKLASGIQQSLATQFVSPETSPR
jgi:hypothetical protein